MSPLSVRRLLGPLPLVRGLLRWGVAILCVLGAWHLYQWYPIAGLVAIGIAPVLSLFLFFRGLNLIVRTLAYWKTRRHLLATRLQPTWEDKGAGYFFVDEQRGLWVINGASGKLTDITRLHAHGDGLNSTRPPKSLRLSMVFATMRPCGKRRNVCSEPVSHTRAGTCPSRTMKGS